jgi:hypothetical protein
MTMIMIMGRGDLSLKGIFSSHIIAIIPTQCQQFKENFDLAGE